MVYSKRIRKPKLPDLLTPSTSETPEKPDTLSPGHQALVDEVANFFYTIEWLQPRLNAMVEWMQEREQAKVSNPAPDKQTGGTTR